MAQWSGLRVLWVGFGSPPRPSVKGPPTSSPSSNLVLASSRLCFSSTLGSYAVSNLTPRRVTLPLAVNVRRSARNIRTVVILPHCPCKFFTILALAHIHINPLPHSPGRIRLMDLLRRLCMHFLCTLENAQCSSSQLFRASFVPACPALLLLRWHERPCKCL